VSIYGEVPSGAVNGTNTVFTLSQGYFAGSTRVFLGSSGSNLTRLELTLAYAETTPASGVITLTTAPASGSKILIDYDVQATATTTAAGTWDFSPSGYPEGAVMYYGPTLFPAGLNASETKTAMFVLGPNGALITVPPLAQGDPGLPPLLTLPTPTTLAAGDSATATLTKTANGGPGTASAYSLALGIPQGAQGPAFTTEILSASDLTGTPAAGYSFVYVPAAGSDPAQVAWAALPFSAIYNATSISNTTTSAGENRTLSSLSIPAQPNLWVPIVWAQTTVLGTVNTVVNLVARLNNGGSGAFSGSQVAIANGVAGPGPATIATMPAFATLITGDSGTGVIAANSGVTIYLNAEEIATTADEYATSNTTYTVGVLPVGIV
jgi:hypothetical protein